MRQIYVEKHIFQSEIGDGQVLPAAFSTQLCNMGNCCSLFGQTRNFLFFECTWENANELVSCPSTDSNISFFYYYYCLYWIYSNVTKIVPHEPYRKQNKALLIHLNCFHFVSLCGETTFSDHVTTMPNPCVVHPIPDVRVPHVRPLKWIKHHRYIWKAQFAAVRTQNGLKLSIGR